MKTKLTKANSNGPSLRTTVPATIVRKLELKEGSCINWELDKEQERWIVKVEEDV